MRLKKNCILLSHSTSSSSSLLFFAHFHDCYSSYSYCNVVRDTLRCVLRQEHFLIIIVIMMTVNSGSIQCALHILEFFNHKLKFLMKLFFFLAYMTFWEISFFWLIYGKSISSYSLTSTPPSKWLNQAPRNSFISNLSCMLYKIEIYLSVESDAWRIINFIWLNLYFFLLLFLWLNCSRIYQIASRDKDELSWVFITQQFHYITIYLNHSHLSFCENKI